MPAPYSAFTFGDPKGISPSLIPGTLVGVAIRGSTSAPVWPSFTFASGGVGIAYSTQFDLAPASSPTTFSIVSGSLPPGLSLASVSGDIGTISGTPTTAGSFTFTIRASNSVGTADAIFTITIAGASASASASGGGSFVWIA